MLTALLACLLIPALAQNAATQRPGSKEIIDEITVVGRKTKPQLGREIRALSLEIYTVFNAENSDDCFDINCVKEARIGRQIFRTICKPMASWNAASEAADQPNEYIPRQDLSDELREEMRAIAARNPRFLRLLVKRKTRINKLESRRDEELRHAQPVE